MGKAKLLKRLRKLPGPATEAMGMGLIAGGLWMVYEPAGVIAAGIGFVLWSQGRGQDEEKQP